LAVGPGFVAPADIGARRRRPADPEPSGLGELHPLTRRDRLLRRAASHIVEFISIPKADRHPARQPKRAQQIYEADDPPPARPLTGAGRLHHPPDESHFLVRDLLAGQGKWTTILASRQRRGRGRIGRGIAIWDIVRRTFRSGATFYPVWVLALHDSNPIMPHR
jgi:hypothetical protein